jgi:hypothetical protein
MMQEKKTKNTLEKNTEIVKCLQPGTILGRYGNLSNLTQKIEWIGKKASMLSIKPFTNSVIIVEGQKFKHHLKGIYICTGSPKDEPLYLKFYKTNKDVPLIVPDVKNPKSILRTPKSSTDKSEDEKPKKNVTFGKKLVSSNTKIEKESKNGLEKILLDFANKIDKDFNLISVCDVDVETYVKDYVRKDLRKEKFDIESVISEFDSFLESEVSSSVVDQSPKKIKKVGKDRTTESECLSSVVAPKKIKKDKTTESEVSSSVIESPKKIRKDKTTESEVSKGDKSRSQPKTNASGDKKKKSKLVSDSTSEEGKTSNELAKDDKIEKSIRRSSSEKGTSERKMKEPKNEKSVVKSKSDSEKVRAKLDKVESRSEKVRTKPRLTQQEFDEWFSPEKGKRIVVTEIRSQMLDKGFSDITPKTTKKTLEEMAEKAVKK